MEYRKLGKSGLKVSEIGLGTNAFGGRADEKTSIGIIEQALDLGVNFLDTAESYTQGHSEEVIGKALKRKRSQAIIATKFGYAAMMGPRELGASRAYMLKAVEASLKRLDTDYIDLYYIHYPDTETPIEETLRAMNDLIRSGKVRYIACSNYAPWQLCEAHWIAKVCNLESFIAVQSRYNILDRAIERELVPCCQAYGTSIVPWGPLASGFLTGKYHRGETPAANTRLAKPPPIYRDILSESNFDRLQKLEAFARERGHSVLELAVAWLLSHPWLGSVIAGATHIEQVALNTAGASWKLSTEDLQKLNEIV